GGAASRPIPRSARRRPKSRGSIRVGRRSSAWPSPAAASGARRSTSGCSRGFTALDLLRHVDYLATVSGGGYIGGFWSKWLQQRSAAGLADTETFPDEFKKSTGNPSNETRVFESPEVRHVHEFSNFLSPRAGLFDTESWGA